MKLFSHFLILSLFITVIGCNKLDEQKSHEITQDKAQSIDSVKTKIYSVDFEKYSNEDRLKIIDLDSIPNYAQLLSEMEKISCEDKVSGLKINTKTTDYFITGSAPSKTMTWLL